MAKKEMSPDDSLTTAQAGVELGVSADRVIMLINEGRLRATRFGKAWAIRRGDLDAVRHRPTGRPPGPSRTTTSPTSASPSAPSTPRSRKTTPKPDKLRKPGRG